MKRLFNNQIKMIKSLQNKKGRIETGLFVAEGIKTVKELIKSGIQVEYIVLDKHLDDKIKDEFLSIIQKSEIFEHTIESLTTMVSSEGIMAVAKTPMLEKSDEFFKNRSNILGLFSINDPGNLGTLIRTAKWFGLDGIILYGNCADIYSPKVLRSSMGAVFDMNFVSFGGFKESRDSISSFHKISTFLHKESNYIEDQKSKKILFLGNEANGIDRSLELEFDSNYLIETKSAFDSLNVSVAGGILMYEIFNSRRGI